MAELRHHYVIANQSADKSINIEILARVRHLVGIGRSLVQRLDFAFTEILFVVQIARIDGKFFGARGHAVNLPSEVRHVTRC